MFKNSSPFSYRYIWGGGGDTTPNTWSNVYADPMNYEEALLEKEGHLKKIQTSKLLCIQSKIKKMEAVSC